LLSCQFQHSLSTVGAATAAAVVAVLTVEAEASMAVVADRIAAVVEKHVVAAPPKARDLMAEEVTAEAAGLKLAAVQAHPERSRRIFAPPSTMASGIRSATQGVPREVP
jgi:hypothetical protein